MKFIIAINTFYKRVQIKTQERCICKQCFIKKKRHTNIT